MPAARLAPFSAAQGVSDVKNTIVLVGLVLLVTGCGGFGPAGFSGDPFAPAEARSLLVLMENSTIDDVRVQARSPRDRYDLGIVTSRTARQTSIPWSEVSNLSFQLDPLTGRRATIQGPSVGPGERVTLVIVDPIDQSYIRR